MMKGRAGDLTIFVLAALGLAWVFALPLWLGAGLASPWLMPAATAVMFTPTLAVLAVWLLRYRDVGAREWARRTGLGLGERRGRTVVLVLAAWWGAPLVVIVALAVSAGMGLFSLDLAGFSLFRESLGDAAPESATNDVGGAAMMRIALLVLIAPLLNIVPVLGEEWGWRGWLLPRLLSRGVWPALAWSGLLWGAWHAPLTLLGYNYPELGPGAAALFTGMCVALGVVMGWLRLYTGSVWPPVLAHGALNATTGLVFVFGDAADPPNLAIAGVTGLVGWVLLVALGMGLLRAWPVSAREPAGRHDGMSRVS